MRAGAAEGLGRSSPEVHLEVCDGLTPTSFANCVCVNASPRSFIRWADNGSSAATRPPLSRTPLMTAPPSYPFTEATQNFLWAEDRSPPPPFGLLPGLRVAVVDGALVEHHARPDPHRRSCRFPRRGRRQSR